MRIASVSPLWFFVCTFAVGSTNGGFNTMRQVDAVVSPRTTLPSSSASQSVGLTSSYPRSYSAKGIALLTPRGGAWYFGKKTAARKYKQLLEEQVTMLNRQLRQSTEELALLRRQLKTSQSLLHKTAGARKGRKTSTEQTVDKLHAIAENRDLKNRVDSLVKEVADLERMRNELQSIIETQHKKMEELELQLQAKGEENANLSKKAEREMERLKKEIESKYQQQINELTNLMNQRIEEAAEHARQVALREMEAKIAQATAEERKRGEKLLEEERKRSEAAVEREKVKMRKLAKALFEREKKLNTLDKDFTSETATSVRAPSLPSSKTGVNSSVKVDTIRKF